MKKTLSLDKCVLVDFLAKIEPEERAFIVRCLNEKSCKALYECVHNALYNKDISPENRKKIKTHLKKDEGCYRSLLKTGLHAKIKHKKLCQVGGKSLGILLNAVLPLMKKRLVEDGQLSDEDETV